MIGIISYLPNDSELRKVRIECAVNTYRYLTKCFPEEIIHIVDQNYTDADREIFGKNIVWYNIVNGVGPAKARNILLTSFYLSSDPYHIICDDDVVFYDYYDADVFMRNLYYGNYDKYGIDICVPLSPNIRPFKEKLLSLNIRDNFVLIPSSLSDIPNFMLLKNTEPKLFYDESLNLFSEDVPEDAEFIMRSMINKKRCYLAMFMVKKSLALYDSVLFPNETAKDTDEHKRLTKNLRNYVETTYNIKATKFSSVYNCATPLIIPRDCKYVLPDNLAVVKNRSRKNTTDMLF